VSGMPDEPTPEPEPAVEGEVVDDIALQPDSPPAPPSAAPAPAPAEPVDTGYTPGGVPTFDSVREKIETRYGTAIGAAELDAESPEGRTIEEQYDARQRAAAERLAEIRKSMHPEEDDAQ
jgi:phage shock protein A